MRRPSSRGSCAPGEKPVGGQLQRQEPRREDDLAVTAASRSGPGSSNGASSCSSQSGSGVASLLSRTAYGVVTCSQRAVVAAGEAAVVGVADDPHRRVDGLEQRERAVAAGVVDDDDLERRDGLSARASASRQAAAGARRSS